MGYILPITHFTYNNYHYRVNHYKKSPHHVGATYKVIFHKINNTYDLHEKNPTYKRREEEVKIPLQYLKINPIQKAELTGKGGQINEQI